MSVLHTHRYKTNNRLFCPSNHSQNNALGTLATLLVGVAFSAARENHATINLLFFTGFNHSKSRYKTCPSPKKNTRDHRGPSHVHNTLRSRLQPFPHPRHECQGAATVIIHPRTRNPPLVRTGQIILGDWSDPQLHRSRRELSLLQYSSKIWRAYPLAGTRHSAGGGHDKDR